MLFMSLYSCYWLSLFPVCNVVCVSVLSSLDCHCFLCAQCFVVLYYCWLSLFPVCPMLSVSLYCLLLIDTVSCVPNVVCVSVLSSIDCHCFLCAKCCLCLCVLYYWLSLFPVCPMLSVSLYSLLLIVTVSCVPNVVCVSVLVYYWLSLFPVCPMLSVSLYSLLLIVTVSCVPLVYVVCVSVFSMLSLFPVSVVCFSVSIIDCHCFLCAQCCLCLCNVYCWLSLFPVCPILSVSLYSLLLIFTVSCMPNVVLCLCIVYYWLSLFPVCPMLSLSLYSLLLIVTVSCVPNVFCVSVFSIIDCHCFLCAQCCLCLCILYYWLSLFHVCPMLSVSLYCLLLIVAVSCLPNVVCVSVLSIIDCHSFLCAQCFLCLCIVYYWLSLFPVCPMLSVSLYWLLFLSCFLCVCPLLSVSLYSLLWIVTVLLVYPNVVCVSVFSTIDCCCFLCAQCCLCLCIVYL